STTHVYPAPGLYLVTLTVRLPDGRSVNRTLVQAVHGPLLDGTSASSSVVALTSGAAPRRLWTVDPDNDLLTGFDAESLTRVAELPVCAGPRSVAVEQEHRIWISCRDGAKVLVLDAVTLNVVLEAKLPKASRPYGLVLSADGRAYVALDGLGSVVELDTTTGDIQRAFEVGATPRGLALTADGGRLLVSRFISPPVLGESTASPVMSSASAELRIVSLMAPAVSHVISLSPSERVDSPVQGRGVPNYLGAPAISPDGATAWVPSKQDNVARGAARDGHPLDFQNTVRAITSRVDLVTESETPASRIDHDDSGVAAAATFHPSGVYLFVARETGRELAVVHALDGVELCRVAVGRAPQALVVSGDGQRLSVKNFMDRSVSVFDLGPLVHYGEFEAPLLATHPTVTSERLPPQ